MGHAAREYFAHRSQIFTETVRAAFIKKHETRRSPTDRRGGNCTDAHGWVFSRIVYSCSAAYCLGFDAPPAQRIATDFSHAENLSMRARFSGHALKGQKFIAQGKRSDTLGKPPHHITLRPVREKANITRSVSALLPLQCANYTAHYTQGVASLAAGLWTSAPFGACLFERISSRPRHVAFSHAYNSPHAKDPCSSVAPAAHQRPSSRQRSKSK